MDNIQIATKIKQLCRNKNIMLKDLLDDCNISRSFIYELKKRDKTPSIEKIALIADYLDVSIDYLVGRTNAPEIIYTTNSINTQNCNIAQSSQSKDLSKEEAEIIGVYRLLDVRNRTRLLSFVLELEDDLQKMQ